MTSLVGVAWAFSKLVAIVRIKKNVSRKRFERSNKLKLRNARGASNLYSKTLVFGAPRQAWVRRK